MSAGRLLRAERLARRAGHVDECLAFNEAVRQMNEEWQPVRAQLQQQQESAARVESEPPLPVPPVEARPVEAPPAPEPPQWWEEYCRWRPRTEADDRDDAEPPKLDDPLGLYS